MVKTAFSAAFLALCATGASAQGCPPADGATVSEIEVLNQQVLDLDFAGLAAAIQNQTGMDVKGGIEGIGKLYAGGFSGCTTIAQRTDVGGLTQTVVMYHGDVGPLFAYWRFAVVNGKQTMLSFSMNSESGEILDKLR